jgi:DHA1 family bicyclomycin/chloramphenicol resistance-like MFS transporter
MQTVGGAVLGTLIGQQFNGTLTPNAAAFVVMALMVLCCMLVAEKGKLFGVGQEYAHAPAVAD